MVMWYFIIGLDRTIAWTIYIRIPCHDDLIRVLVFLSISG
jgi:hypothetical protein